MPRHRTTPLLICLSFLWLLTTLAHADFQTGKDAYKRGDYETAFKEWQPLAEQGDVDAQFLLGRLYAWGQGVPQDYTQARLWYRKAAAQDHAIAQGFLGGLYHFGNGVSQDYTQARAWLRKSAAQGYAGAQFLLGLMYAKGQGMPQDFAQAADWYRKAAAQGLQGGQYHLGRLYARGQGVPQDYVQAHMWYSLAAAQCQENQWMIVTARKEITIEMTSAQIAEAQRLAREWKPSQDTSFCAIDEDDLPPLN